MVCSYRLVLFIIIYFLNVIIIITSFFNNNRCIEQLNSRIVVCCVSIRKKPKCLTTFICLSADGKKESIGNSKQNQKISGINTV
jgi:hypothetical protein